MTYSSLSWPPGDSTNDASPNCERRIAPLTGRLTVVGRIGIQPGERRLSVQTSTTACYARENPARRARSSRMATNGALTAARSAGPSDARVYA